MARIKEVGAAIHPVLRVEGEVIKIGCSPADLIGQPALRVIPERVGPIHGRASGEIKIEGRGTSKVKVAADIDLIKCVGGTRLKTRRGRIVRKFPFNA